VLAQAPVNDIVSWPPGLLLLATVLYSALGAAPDRLWQIDPSIGFSMWSGLPFVSIPGMRRVTWVASACHFIPGIRSAYGISNFWVRADEITDSARAEARVKVLSLLSCVLHEPLQSTLDEDLWRVTPEGLLESTYLCPLSRGTSSKSCQPPSAHDFLLFAALDYHVFRRWDVQVISKGSVAFSTKGMIRSLVIDVDNVEMALLVVAAQLVDRPHTQSPLRGYARLEGDDLQGPYILNLDHIRRDIPVCNIDFHSYAPVKSMVSASLNELAGAYYRVVQHIKKSITLLGTPESGHLACIHVGQTLWIAILSGAVLDRGRLTIQNLPGRWAMMDVSADEAYLSRIEALLQVLKPYANTASFGDIVFSGGTSCGYAIPFLLARLFAQIAICYFLAVGTTAGVWNSVALANALCAEKLTDLHSMYLGKTSTSDAEEPGMKMYVPGSTKLMAIATFDRSPPCQGVLRPGVLLNSAGLLAGILGVIFQTQTRKALGFAPFRPSQPWVLYTTVVLSGGLSIITVVGLAAQQVVEKIWQDNGQLPTRWIVYTTLPCSILVAGLGAFFQATKLSRFWPVLEMLTWLSGLPLGMLENGRMTAVDMNLLHLVLVNRWLMGSVASALGSSQKGPH
jgi:hypothetical protein